MSSRNDFNSMYGWDSPAVPTMYSQGQGLAPNPSVTNPMVTMPEVSGDWMSQFKNVGIPSFMSDGFSPSNPGGGGFLEGFKSWGKDWIGSSAEPGPLGFGLGAAQGIFNGYMGMKQYGLAKEKLAESKRQFELNYGAQKSLNNSLLEDRQRARVASNAGAYQSVGDYMDKNGVK